MAPSVLHLHTYFLFPFSVDREAVVEDHKDLWARHTRWIDGLDAWIGAHRDRSPLIDHVGAWRRAAYTRFDMDSQAYQDMIFFHPYVRRVFFDTSNACGGGGEQEALLRCYVIPIPPDTRLRLFAEDARGRSATVDVTDLRLFLFANGIGILSLGVEALRCPVSEALWINEMMRKVYPSSARQIREGRISSRTQLRLEREGATETLVEERFETGSMSGYLPPLSGIITSLLYFADYDKQEFEPVLDERMIVYSYVAIDPASVPEGFANSEDYEHLLARLLWVDRDGPGFRYDPEFSRAQMRDMLYRRWAHQGTWYGFTSYSNITSTMGTFECDEHVLREGFLVHRMFDTRYYLMALVALFYRATLLDFAERSALVSKRFYLDYEDNRLSPENIRLANMLRAQFLHFSNYWYFEELANKDEEIEHFTLQCRSFRIEPIKNEIETEIEKLDTSMQQYFQNRNTEAVNRLAMLSMILGAGAVLTGFFGMNFGRLFSTIFFQPDAQTLWIHRVAIAVVTLTAFGALSFGVWVIASHWSDYREILAARSLRAGAGSLKRRLPERVE